MGTHRILTVIEKITESLGSVPSILLAAGMVGLWFAVGIVTGLLTSDPYQLLINTSTTIITFLMVFVIQNSQNRDSQAVEAKLDEIMRALEGADDVAMTGIEDLPEKEIRKLKRERPRQDSNLRTPT